MLIRSKQNAPNQTLLNGTLMQIGNLPIYSNSYKNNILKVSHS